MEKEPSSVALWLQVSGLIWPPCGGRIGFGWAEDNHPNGEDWMLLGHGGSQSERPSISSPSSHSWWAHPAPIYTLSGLKKIGGLPKTWTLRWHGSTPSFSASKHKQQPAEKRVSVVEQLSIAAHWDVSGINPTETLGMCELVLVRPRANG